MRLQVIAAVLSGSLAACASAPSPPDREAEDASAQLVGILSKQKLVEASRDWPVSNGAAGSGERPHGFYAAVPQTYLPPLGGDLPQFRVRGNAGCSEFWIQMREGPAGAQTWYGPLVLDDLGRPVTAGSLH